MKTIYGVGGTVEQLYEMKDGTVIITDSADPK